MNYKKTEKAINEYYDVLKKEQVNVERELTRLKKALHQNLELKETTLTYVDTIIDKLIQKENSKPSYNKSAHLFFESFGFVKQISASAEMIRRQLIEKIRKEGDVSQDVSYTTLDGQVNVKEYLASNNISYTIPKIRDILASEVEYMDKDIIDDIVKEYQNEQASNNIIIFDANRKRKRDKK